MTMYREEGWQNWAGGLFWGLEAYVNLDIDELGKGAIREVYSQ